MLFFDWIGLCHRLSQHEELSVFYSLLPATIYEQYLLSRLANGKSPFWYRSASSFRTLSLIGFFPLNNALRHWMPFSSTMLTSVKNSCGNVLNNRK